MSRPTSVFDVLDHLQRPEDQLAWIAVGASDALRNFDSDPEQYTSRKARACYRLGYYLMKRIIGGRGLPGKKNPLRQRCLRCSTPLYAFGEDSFRCGPCESCWTSAQLAACGKEK